MHWIKIFTLSLLLAISAGFAANSIAGKLFRWTDAEGKVHYSDKVPPEHSRSGRSQLDTRGFEVDRVEKAKNKEEIAQEEELKRMRAETQRQIGRQKEKDRVLLHTFRTEDDLMMASNGKLSAIDVLIHITRSSIRQMKLRLAYYQKRAATMERQGKSISQNLHKNIESTRLQLQDAYASIIRKEQEKETIREKTESDLARFRTLKDIVPEDATLVAMNRSGSLLETVVTCPDNQICDKKWILAENYVRKYASTRLQMLSKTIIMTGAALKDSDISITVSKIREKDLPGAKLFMDLQCKNSPRGEDLCKTKKVKLIRTGFRPFLTKKG